MEKILKNKSNVIAIIVAIFIVGSVIGMNIGIRYEQTINTQKAADVISINTKKQMEEREYYDVEFNKTRKEFVESTSELYKETKDKTGFNFDRDSKQRMASALVKLGNITKENNNLKVPTNIDNIQIYSDIKDMRSSIDKFSTKFIDGVDNKSKDSLDQAAEEIKNINKIIDSNNKIKQ